MIHVEPHNQYERDAYNASLALAVKELERTFGGTRTQAPTLTLNTMCSSPYGPQGKVRDYK